ncbi:YqaA family protein [Dickeya poaceiphila]|uniref:DedA family protein n=1 Tax=Dickeya poaceiphila TaxID=568768 RepID=A0A5B8IA30_9GAMM|nr:YqaA family protein [Dickeya poaceiphila]QDX31111.1 DedA family protein [Dickeya poaceiphila]
MNESLALFSLFWSSFLSATLLPGSSEVVLVSLLLTHSASPLLLILIASIGNTLGGVTNIIVGRLVPELKPQKGLDTARCWLQRYGTAALLFSWVPIVGDILCVLAGWLRMPWAGSVICIFIGKTLRYLILAVVTLKWTMGTG